MIEDMELPASDDKLAITTGKKEDSHGVELRQTIIALENKPEIEYSDQDFSLIDEVVKAGLAVEVFKLAITKNAIDSKNIWKWRLIFTKCVNANESLAVSFCNLFKNKNIQEYSHFKDVFIRCIANGAAGEFFNLLQKISFENLLQWDEELILIIASRHDTGSKLFSLFFANKKISELRSLNNVLAYFNTYLAEGNQLLESLKGESLEEIKFWKDFLKRFLKDPDFSEKALSLLLDHDDFKAQDLPYWHDVIKTSIHPDVKNNSLKLISFISKFDSSEIESYESIDILNRVVYEGFSLEVVSILSKFDLEKLKKRGLMDLLNLCAEKGAAREILLFLKSKIKNLSETRDWIDLIKTCVIEIGSSFVNQKQ